MSFLVPVEAAASAVMGAVSEGGTTFYGGFMDKISAANSLEQIHGTLNDAVKRLLAKRDDCQNRLQRHKNKMPTNTYNNWVCRVLEIEEDVKDFETKFEKENKGSRVWHVLSRSELCQEMKDKCQRVLKLLEESNQLGEYLVDQPPKPVEVMGAPEIQKFQTFQMHVDNILNLLRNDKVKGIRIHGMVGSGKTALMLSLNNHKEVGNLFDIVIWVKVSTEGSKENLSTEQLQRAIVRRLKLDMEITSDTCEVAERISEDLKGKRVMSTTANAVEGTNRIVKEAPRDVSQEAPSRAAASKRRLLAADKGKAVASSGNGKRGRVDQTSGVLYGISIREPGTT